MKKELLITLLSMSLLVSGCTPKKNKESSSNLDPSSSVEPSSSEEDPVPDGKVRVKFAPMINSSRKEDYVIDFDYDLAYFKEDASIYSKDISMLSFGAVTVNQTKEMVLSFYERLGFENHYTSATYDTEPTEDSIGYYFGHANVDNKDLIVVSIRGWNYKKEWCSNFKIGETGNHDGFDEAAQTVYNDLKTYISNRYADKELKLWVNGYSRAGGVANVLATYIMDNHEINTDAHNAFFYTYEAPQGVYYESEEQINHYDNVFNIVNGADLIANIAPKQYSLYRCGKDVDVFASNIDELVKEFDSTIEFPKFTPDSGDEPKFTTEVEFTNYLISQLLRVDPLWEDTDKGITVDMVALDTRERFFNNYQETIMTAMNLFFSLKQETIDSIVDYYNPTPDNIQHIMALLSALYYVDGLYGCLKPFLDKDGLTYDEAKVKHACNQISQFVMKPGMILLTMFMNDNNKNNLMRTIYMHMPEVNYMLLKQYNENKE